MIAWRACACLLVSLSVSKRTRTLSLHSVRTFCPEWGPDPPSARPWRPLRTGAGHGRSGRSPGRCGCAVTSLLQRDGGGAVRFRQEIRLPAQLVVVGGRGRWWRGSPSVAACLRWGAGRRSCPTLRRRRAALWGRLRSPSASTSHPSSYSRSSAPTAQGCRLGGCPAGRDRCGVEGTQRAVGWMSGDHDRCFSTLVPEAF